MARPLYSVRFFSAEVTTAAETELFTVPESRSYVLRDIDMLIVDPAAVGEVLVLAGSVALALYNPGGAVPVNIPWRGRQVFPAGTSLFVIAPGLTSNSYHVTASGYDLAVP